MRKILLIVCALALPISACTTTPLAPPAPLAKTTIDDTALSAAWQAFDAALDAIDLYQALSPHFAGTPKALAVASAVDKATAFLTAAENAAAAGSANDYITALANAKAALAELRTALGRK